MTIMVQHYFIGFKIPEKEAQQLDQIRSKWELQSTHKVIPHASDLHITLLYLGAVEEKAMQRLSERLNALQETCSSFDLTLKGVSSFGSPSNPRVVYVSTEEQDKLKLLQKNVKLIAESLNFKVDQKPFVPHITLAKKWKGKQDFNMDDKHIDQMNFMIKYFSIYSIHPQKTPSYHPVKSVVLKDQ